MIGILVNGRGVVVVSPVLLVELTPGPAVVSTPSSPPQATSPIPAATQAATPYVRKSMAAW